MHLDRRLLNWGIFFVLLGALPLAVQEGAVSRDILGGAWRLWPLVIVGLGIGLLLRRTPLDFAGGLVIAASFGLILGSLLAAGPGITAGCGGGSIGSYDTAGGTFDGPARVDVRLGCGDLTVATGPGSAWSVRSGNSAGDHAAVVSTPTSLTLRPSGEGSGLFGLPAGRDDWQVALPIDVPLALALEVNAGSARIDLAGARVDSTSLTVNAGETRVDLGSVESSSQFSATVNAGTTYLTLPPTFDTTGSITVNAGSLDICVPSGLGLQISAHQTLGGTNFEAAGLVQNGELWTTPDLGTAAHRARLSITTNLGGVTLNPSGGCS